LQEGFEKNQKFFGPHRETLIDAQGFLMFDFSIKGICEESVFDLCIKMEINPVIDEKNNIF
jgi:hypothetical protein